MELKKQYKDINDTLHHLKIQVIEGLPYAVYDLPAFHSADEIFNYLKARTTYKNDPRGVELLQTLPTLLNKNFHRTPGAGDCDCFTIALLTILIANNFNNLFIALVGRSRRTPVHIYVVIYENKKRKVLDLTNKRAGIERPYPYIQELPINYKNWN